MSSAPSGQPREVEQALAVRGHERADEDQRGDPVGAVRRRLRDHDSAHAAADEHGRLGRCASTAQTRPRSVERDPLRRSRVVAASGEVERLDRVPAASSGPTTGSQLQRAAERAVDEDEAAPSPGEHIPSGDQDDLALRTPRLAQLVRARDLLEREGSLHVGTQLPASTMPRSLPAPSRSGSTRMPVTLTRPAAASSNASRPAPDGDRDEDASVAQARHGASAGVVADEVEHDVDVARRAPRPARSCNRSPRRRRAPPGTGACAARPSRSHRRRAPWRSEPRGARRRRPRPSIEHALTRLDLGGLDERLPRGQRRRAAAPRPLRRRARPGSAPAVATAT